MWATDGRNITIDHHLAADGGRRGGLAYGQDDARPDQLRQRYPDALAELKSAQDRMNHLAADNERFTARLADLTKAAEEFDDRTFFLRSHYAAWKAFVAADPALRWRWGAYLRGRDDDGAFPPRLDPQERNEPRRTRRHTKGKQDELRAGPARRKGGREWDEWTTVIRSPSCRLLATPSAGASLR